MSALVVDASVAIKWLVLEEDTDKAIRLLESGRALYAPRLIFIEVANALARKVREGVITQGDAAEYVGTMPRFFKTMLDTDDLVTTALENACTYLHPVYDFIYLEAARRWDAQMLTADGRFVAKIRATDLGRFVILLSEWSA
ncbi:MAG: type II toxin-antitoxin system VapC family toxin [Proteobacteria bacterium]|nr:type II toxin-antitoxin system VapC family toxin [Pseudomonadota bacterium]